MKTDGFSETQQTTKNLFDSVPIIYAVFELIWNSSEFYQIVKIYYVLAVRFYLEYCAIVILRKQ